VDSVLSDSDLKLKLLNLERLLAQTVQLSQTLTQARGATVADAVIMVLEDRGVQEAPDLRQDIPDCQAALARTVAAEAPPCGWVATAIHGAGEQAESRAFSIISLAGALFVVETILDHMARAVSCWQELLTETCRTVQSGWRSGSGRLEGSWTS